MSAAIFRALVEVQAGIRGPMTAWVDPVDGLHVTAVNPGGGYTLLDAVGQVFGAGDVLQTDGCGSCGFGSEVTVDGAIVEAFVRGAEWGSDGTKKRGRRLVGLLLAELDAAAAETEDLADLCDRWRRRAEAAERRCELLMDDLDEMFGGEW